MLRFIDNSNNKSTPQGHAVLTQNPSVGIRKTRLLHAKLVIEKVNKAAFPPVKRNMNKIFVLAAVGLLALTVPPAVQARGGHGGGGGRGGGGGGHASFGGGRASFGGGRASMGAGHPAGMGGARFSYARSISSFPRSGLSARHSVSAGTRLSSGNAFARNRTPLAGRSVLQRPGVTTHSQNTAQRFAGNRTAVAGRSAFRRPGTGTRSQNIGRHFAGNRTFATNVYNRGAGIHHGVDQHWSHHHHHFAYIYPSLFGLGYGYGAFGYPYYGYGYGSPNYYDGYGYAGLSTADVQQALAELGYYQGPVDGVIAGYTIEAIRAFQADNGLPVTGRVDGSLVSTLGLGY